MQCGARNDAAIPYTCCLDDEGHSGIHWDYQGNEWMGPRHFNHRARRVLRFSFEADVTGLSDEVIEALRGNIEYAASRLLQAEGVFFDTDRSRRVEATQKPIVTTP